MSEPFEIAIERTRVQQLGADMRLVACRRILRVPVKTECAILNSFERGMVLLWSAQCGLNH